MPFPTSTLVYAYLAVLLLPRAGLLQTRASVARLLASLVMQLHLAQVHDLRELHRLVAIAPSDELRQLLGGTASQPFLEPGNERMLGSIRSVTTSRSSAWLDTPRKARRQSVQHVTEPTVRPSATELLA